LTVAVEAGYPDKLTATKFYVYVDEPIAGEPISSDIDLSAVSDRVILN